MKCVVQICISVIQIRTSVKEFSVYIIQIQIRVESIQFRHRAEKRLFEHSNSLLGIQIRNKFIQFSMHFTYAYLYDLLKQNVWNNIRLYTADNVLIDV